MQRGKDQLSIEVPVIDSVDDPQRFADMVNPEDNLVPQAGHFGHRDRQESGRHAAGSAKFLRRGGGGGIQPTDLSSGTGLQPGDVIYSVNGSPVTTVAALKAKLKDYKTGQPIVMQIERSSVLMYVTIELE